MIHRVLSVGEFIDKNKPLSLENIRDCFISIDWDSVIGQSIPERFEFLPIATDDRLLSHQLYLLNHSDDIFTINKNESLLYRSGYDPIALSENGTYFDVLNKVTVLNENLSDSVLTVLKRLTNSEEGFNERGVLQFILDILGMIPGSLVGFPIDIAANLTNAMIYMVHEEWILMLVNLIALVPLGSIFAAPLKGGIKLYSKTIGKVSKLLATSGSGKAAADLAKAEIKDPNFLKLLGTFLGKVANWIAQTGLSLLKKIIPGITGAIRKITLGAVDLTKWSGKLTGLIEQLSAKLKVLGKEATDASKELLSSSTAASATSSVKTAYKKIGQAAVDQANLSAIAKRGKPLNPQAQAWVRSGAEWNISKTAGQVGKYSNEVMAKSAAKFDKMFPTMAAVNSKAKELFIISDATTQMVENVLSKKSGLLSLTGNKLIMKTLSSGKVWKGADKMLSKAIRNGNPEQLRSLMTKIMDDPDFYKLISKNSPDVAKTIALFKEAPEALIQGSKTFKEFGANLIKIGGKGSVKANVIFSAKRLPIFILKLIMKGNDCMKHVISADSAEDAINLASAAITQQGAFVLEPDLSQIQEIASSAFVFEEEEVNTGNQEVDKAILDAQTQAQAAAEKLKEQTNPKNPCSHSVQINGAVVGTIIDANNRAWKKGTYSTDLVTQKDWEESNLTNYTKDILQKLHQDTGIDAQHPLRDQSPIVKAYFSDVVISTGAIDPNTSQVSRLDETLDQMVKNGELAEQDKSPLRQKIIDSWNNNTVPTEVLSSGMGSPNQNESIMRVRKLAILS